MTTNESLIEAHYSHNHLYETIVQALASTGITANNISRKDIAAIDEFHVRGQEVSHELAAAAGLQPGMRILDAGCGLGGACRMLADEYDCDITGIDITGDYIRTAQQLSVLTGLQHAIRFVQGSVLALPFNNNTFDIVWTQHVQMNIADKKTFYAEIQRVLTTGGRFIYYDILSHDHLPVHFPVPWASDAALSFLITSQQLHTLLHDCGFQPIQVKDETGKGIAFFNNLFHRITQKGLPALGLHLLMGDTALEKLSNLRKNLIEGNIVLESGIFELKS
ncbi:MAG TPA: class I SAM-dependent methyltransferase [Niastella sp.]